MTERTKTASKSGAAAEDATALTATECAVLGMLTFGERSGYDLLKLAEGSVGFFWSPAKTQLYAVLRKLVERGFATARRVRQDDRPDKELYRITRAGEEALRAGLADVHSAVDRDPFQLKLFFGGYLPRETLVRLIEDRRDRQRAHLARLERIEKEMDKEQDFFPYLTLLHGKESARGRIRWANRALKLLEERGDR